jgi:hypothetical protein
MASSSPIGLFFGGAESSFGICHIGHVFVVVVVVVLGWRRCRSGFFGSSLLFGRTLDKATLDSHATIGEILTTIVSDLFVPDSSRSFLIEASNNCGTFGGSVDSNAAILVVDLIRTVIAVGIESTCMSPIDRQYSK